MSIYYLDTNICSYSLNRKSRYHDQVKAHLDECAPGELRIPIIVKAEMLFGMEKGDMQAPRRAVHERFFRDHPLVNLDDAALLHYARTRATLERAGTLIGPNDLFIAAIVLAHNGILVTHNTKEFSRIEGLKLEDWTE
jgi:tRNA(fMet)-specific endonuclease VapC